MKNDTLTTEYEHWIESVKSRVRTARVRTALAANSELIRFYWNLGKMISTKLIETGWGGNVVNQLSIDLQKEFPHLKGFSRRNLYYTKKFYEVFSELLIAPQVGALLKDTIEQDQFCKTSESDTVVPQREAQIENDITPQLVEHLPWGHIKVVIDKLKSPSEIHFYVEESLKNGWNRDVLALQIKSELHKRQGSAVTNFSNTLPSPQSDLVQQVIKDPYRFDFLEMTKPYNERDIEQQLVDQIQKFLLELGKGFAFIGKQYHLEIGESDYYLDLLFYHIHLKCYVVVELKNTKFIPEYAGKLNFYLSAVDEILKTESENPTIGIMLCRDKNCIETEFALRGMSQPMGVSEFSFTEILPEELKGSMPTVEEIEREIGTSGEIDV